MIKNIILNDLQIRNKIKRISLQITEDNINENEIVVVGIEPKGFKLAEEIVKKIKEISKINLILCKIKIDKKKPFEELSISIDKENLKNKSVVLVDDVLNSGSTLICSVKFLLNIELKKLKTAVLINRSHTKFPITANFNGLSLSTSLQNHIEVKFEENSINAYLI